MKVTFDILRKIKTNSTMEFPGNASELNTAKSLAYQLNVQHPEEGRKYSIRTDYKKGSVYITAMATSHRLVEAK